MSAVVDSSIILVKYVLTGYGGLGPVHEGLSHSLREELFGSDRQESTLQCFPSLSQSSKDYVQPSPQLYSQALKGRQKRPVNTKNIAFFFLLSGNGQITVAKSTDLFIFSHLLPFCAILVATPYFLLCGIGPVDFRSCFIKVHSHDALAGDDWLYQRWSPVDLVSNNLTSLGNQENSRYRV